jgi:hypothetical protein
MIVLELANPISQLSALTVYGLGTTETDRRLGAGSKDGREFGNCPLGGKT